jgi:hypothetical protein
LRAAARGAVLDNVDIWLWGHEHRLDIYDEYRRVKRGRCLGCSAVPVFIQDEYFSPKRRDIPLMSDPHSGDRTVTLGDNGSTYNLAYAVMKLDARRAQIEYFQNSEESTPLVTESIT